MILKNLFFIFDPSPLYTGNLGWGSGTLMLTIIFLSTKNKEGINNLILRLKRVYIYSEISVITNYNKNCIFIRSLMVLIIYINVIGLFPYIFTNSSHLVITLSLGLPLWMGPIFYKILTHTNSFLSHLIPQGTPVSILLFIILVETISLLIRPITLSVRLAANIISGHLLITLLSNQAVIIINIKILVILVQTILLILEFRISFIQAYVFTILSALYIRENI